MIYRYPTLKKTEVKGVVLLSNFDASLTTPLLADIAQQLANANYIAAILEHRANQANDFTTEAAKVGEDYRNVWNTITVKYGGTIDKTVLGGVSFTGFALSANVFSNTWFRNIKGLALIASGTSAGIPVPVINKVCDGDADTNSYGNKGGTDLQNDLISQNPTIAAASSCETDNICTGHNLHNSWATFFVTKIKAWLP